MSQKYTASNNLQTFARSKSNYSALLIGVLICLFVCEWFLFHRFFSRYIAHYLLCDWDQIGIYSRIYRLHFGLEQSGVQYLLANGQSLIDKQSMKGTFTALLGVITTALFGPSRLAVISVNFFLFVSGQIAVATAAFRRFGLPAALLAVGLYLLSMTHYILVGGINDMRLDYAAMVVMGWAFLANFLYLEMGGRPRFWFGAFTLLLNVLTRSILIIYWCAGAGMLWLLSLLRSRLQLWKHQNISPRRVFNILVVAVGVFALFLLVFWGPFSNYYLFRIANGEAALRAKAYGCSGYGQIFAYNCARFIEHFQFMFESAFILLAGVTVFNRDKFAMLKSSVNFANSAFCLMFCTFSVGCLMAISCFMPSPNHIGVLTIPCALFLTFALNSLIDPGSQLSSKSKLFLSIASAFVFASGIGLFAKEMLHPSHPPRFDAEVSDLVKRSNEILAREMEQRDVSFVCYPILSEEWHFAHLEVFWYENKKKPLPENYGPEIVTPFQNYKWKDLEAKLDEATFVVLPVREPKRTDEEYELKGQAIVRGLMPQIKKKLEKSFYPVAVLDNNTGYSVGIFKNRKP